MTGLLGYALAGGVQGYGEGVVAEAQAAREEALLRLKRGWQVEDRDLGFKHQKEIASMRASSSSKNKNKYKPLNSVEQNRVLDILYPERKDTGGEFDMARGQAYISEINRLRKEAADAGEDLTLEDAIDMATGNEEVEPGTPPDEGKWYIPFDSKPGTPEKYSGKFKNRQKTGLNPTEGEADGEPDGESSDMKQIPPDVMEAAKDAIKRGADREAVIARLKEKGFDVSGVNF